MMPLALGSAYMACKLRFGQFISHMMLRKDEHLHLAEMLLHHKWQLLTNFKINVKLHRVPTANL